MLAHIRFFDAGCDPLNLERSLNFVEQLNQTFTIIASIEGAKWLLRHHPDRGPFHLNLGTTPGPDIWSHDGSIAAETFAATRPTSNGKLRKDIEKIRKAEASLKFVFYISPTEASEVFDHEVRVVRLQYPAFLPQPTTLGGD